MASRTSITKPLTAAPPEERAPNGATAPQSRLPNLIVIGAMKASTTTFYESINRHPQVWFPAEKEPHYFTSPGYGATESWNAYCRLFNAAPPDAQVIGEASTGYSKTPHFGDTPQRIRDALGAVKLIYLVRDPVDRAVSNYQHAYAMGHYPRGTTFGEAMGKDPILLDASRYAQQIRAYHNVFDADDLLVILTDELHSNPANVMRRVEDFLSISHASIWNEPTPQRNAQDAVHRATVIRKMLPAPFLRAIRRIAPAGIRDRAKRLLPVQELQIPTVMDEERATALERVAGDLEDLIIIMGPSISNWPSVRCLKEVS